MSFAKTCLPSNTESIKHYNTSVMSLVLTHICGPHLKPFPSLKWAVVFLWEAPPLNMSQLSKTASWVTWKLTRKGKSTVGQQYSWPPTLRMCTCSHKEGISRIIVKSIGQTAQIWLHFWFRNYFLHVWVQELKMQSMLYVPKNACSLIYNLKKQPLLLCPVHSVTVCGVLCVENGISREFWSIKETVLVLFEHTSNLRETNTEK